MRRISNYISSGGGVNNIIDLGELIENTITVKFDNSVLYKMVITQNTIINIDNTSPSRQFNQIMLNVIQNTVGNNTLTLTPSTIKYPYGTIPNISSLANSDNFITIFSNDYGNTLYAFSSGNDFKAV